MSELTTEKEVAEDIEGMKAEKYDELQQEFLDDEISEEEFEEELDQLFESGEEFLDAEPDTGPNVVESTVNRIAELVDYYLLPIMLVAPFLLIIATPGISPFIALLSAPAIAVISVILYWTITSM